MVKHMFLEDVNNLISDDKWLIFQNEYNTEVNPRYETLFTLTNGYMGVRGTFEEGSEGERSGNFIAGIFDKSDAQVREIVNAQNWLRIKLYVEGEELSLDKCQLIEFKRILDMKKGILFRSMLIKDSKDRITRIEGYRFISRSDLHRSAIKLFVTPVNYSGVVGIESIIDGTVLNSADSPKHRVKHLKVADNSSLNKSGVYLETATIDDDIRIATGSAVRLYHYEDKEKNNIAKFKRFLPLGEMSIEYFEFDSTENKTVVIDKFVITYTSRDVRKDLLKSTVEKELFAFAGEGIDKELQRHIEVYEELWSVADINIEGDEEADKALRFNIFHLMSSVNENDPLVSIAAKALHGEGYKGHVFWDTEIFMLPFFIYVYPQAARTLLMYRYNMLDAARKNAALNGYKGAQYPWESADTGEEETPKWGFDYKGNPVRIWTGDLEHHITADIAFAVWEYFRATEDIEFMLNYGAEIIFETARFWVSRCEYVKELDRYEINNVIGPDEFHEHVDNNAYTNYLAKWNIKKGLELINMLKEKYPEHYHAISNKICLTNEEMEKWKEVEEKIYIPYDKDKKLIEQFEGYFDKKDYVIDKFDENNMPIWPEGVDITKLGDTQLIKQADVVMLMLLLGEEFDEETKRINYEYYEKRTMHKSSLGPSMYAIMGLKVGDHKNAYQSFMRSANVDLVDNQGNTKEGLHAASAGGTWQVAVFGFGGMEIDKEGALNINSWLPEKWDKLSYKVFWKGNLIEVIVTKQEVTVKKLKGKGNIKVKVKGKELTIE
ncbi:MULTISPECIES: glycoside hydrolase family 65 protein [Thermoanaerobacter]|uniref:Kojibiose phosphorylase n=2 Tax=Thermoanaerobacter TaxID=1754 RepID=B0KAN4_THEP3|nr:MULTISPECIES: glycosyl hydrolase family 65 protein [Thermoanaerobacter]ABY95168.1 Kojibiose phosphorylase [Thermoanaerobacter pseudethanolicus ATCC 33223]ADV80117.1 glycoside hydrolase family 65 central catalytic [Thermoanaerobacter brockii subsp. finnii Ako-1]HBW60618.1 glycoside hydrolase family 65 protein [Thermoanaerobacter sp.]